MYLQLPVKMVRCGQHATLAVQLAASSAPLWGRKSTSSAAVPTIAEEDASCGAHSGSASPPLAAPLTMTTTSCIEGVMTPVLASAVKQEVQPASLPGQAGVLRAGSTASQSGAGPTQRDPATQNGNHGHEATSKELLAGPIREAEAQQLPSKGARAPAVPASEVFREHQPCRRPAKPLQGSPNMPSESLAAGLHANGSVSGSGLRESSSYIEGRVGSSHVKLAQLHPPGSMAAQSQMLSDSAGGRLAVPPSKARSAVLYRLHSVQPTAEQILLVLRDGLFIVQPACVGTFLRACLEPLRAPRSHSVTLCISLTIWSMINQSRAPSVLVILLGLTGDTFSILEKER